MIYQVVVNKRALKALQFIPEPYYSKIKATIFSLGVILDRLALQS